MRHLVCIGCLGVVALFANLYVFAWGNLYGYLVCHSVICVVTTVVLSARAKKHWALWLYGVLYIVQMFHMIAVYAVYVDKSQQTFFKVVAFGVFPASFLVATLCKEIGSRARNRSLSKKLVIDDGNQHPSNGS